MRPPPRGIFSRFRPAPALGGLALVALVLWFYGWSTGVGGDFRAGLGGSQPDYYNLLVDGFLDGQVAMKKTPDPSLRPGPDGSNVGTNAIYLLDASYYYGKYYLYFGATPALTLFLPCSLLLGGDLPEWLAAAGAAGIAYALAIGWLALLRRHFFPNCGAARFWLAAALMGLANGFAVVLRRPTFYEIAVLSGCCCALAGLLCLTQAALTSRARRSWTAIGSLCAGLAVGARPIHLLGASLALAIAGGWFWRQDRAARRDGWGSLLRWGIAAFGPFAVCLALVGWYNWDRFGNPLEFGLSYQLGSDGRGFHVSLAALWRNLRVYYLSPPRVGWFFPFFTPGPKPAGSNPEQVHGYFFFLPLLAILAATAIAVCRRREGRRPLAFILLMTGAWLGLNLLFVASVPFHSDRYSVDFHPLLLMSAVAAILLASVPGTRGWGALRWWLGAAALVLVAVQVVFSSFHTQGYFRGNDPAGYARLARFCDRLAWPVQRLLHPNFGGFALEVVFPAGSPGRLYPLVVAGATPENDAIMIKYMDPSHGRLVFNHQEYGAVEGTDFELQPGRLRRMEVRLGSLCPPEWHPWYATLPRGAVRLRTHVSVRLDGVEVLATDADCFPASPGQLWIGERGGERSGEESFNGRIMGRKSLEPDRAWVRGLTEQSGSLRLKVRFPRDRYGVSEPLLLTGVQGRADAVFVTYLQEGLARFSFQHEGQALIVSGPLAVDYLQPHEILIDLGSLAPAVPSSRQASGVRVEMDGRAVLESESATHPAEGWQAYVGATPWPMNTSRPLFGGTILEATRTGDAQAALDAAVARHRPVELELWLPRHRSGEREPLLVTGKSGAGDSVYLQYVDEGHVIVGFDHWGSAPVVSPPVALDYAVAQRVTLALGALTGGEPGRLQVSLNDLPVIDTSAQFYPATAATLGRNAISASTSGPAFTGTILGVSAR